MNANPSLTPLRILHVEDNVGDAELIHALLHEEWPNCRIQRVQTREDFLGGLASQQLDLILSDFSLPQFDGLSALKLAHEHAPSIPFIFLSGTIGEDNAVRALQQGATDYVIKDRMRRLIPAVHAALVRAREAARHRTSERKFHDLFEFAADAIVMMNAEGLIMMANLQAEKLFGHPRGELVGQPIGKLLSAAGPHGPTDLRQEFLRDITPRTLNAGQAHLRGLRKDGGEFPVDVSLSPLESEGGTWVAVAIRDVSEREQAHRLTLRTQRLESIGTLAGGIAHDLNNSLAPILMGIELLRMQYPNANKIVDTMGKSAKRGADMVRQLLTFAKGIEGERQLLQLKHLIKELEKIIEASFPKNIELAIYYPGNLRPILGDATQLHQVLLNLCVNARDAMPKGGKLSIEAENLVITSAHAPALPEANPGAYVVCRVRDTGTGIPPEIMERIFEPFFSTKGPDKGTGLGLSTVIGIVKSHGGVVRVQSAVGQGSTFSLYLPAEESQGTVDSGTPFESTDSFRGNGETILVVDDEADVRQISRAVLTALNFHVITAADGTDAITQVAKRQTDLRVVITDVRMPHMDGHVFVKVLKHLLPDAGIIVASGLLEESEADEFKRLGVSALLDKPFTQEKLVEALKTVFAKGG
jgi:PAS domain S-box-containing protein